MTTDGGGWTTLMVSREWRYDNSLVEQEAPNAAPPVPGQAGNSYLPQPIALALANKSSTVRISEPGTSKAIWSSHPVVMGNLRAGRIANYTTEWASDPSGYWAFSGGGFTQLRHDCAYWLTPEHAQGGQYPWIYWADCNSSGLHMGPLSAAWDFSVPNGQMVVSYR